jgi:bisphosphoglycerate-dependent phosphoglycerate mutase
MKHDEITYRERDLTDWGISQGANKQNVRTKDMLSKCSDEMSIELAEAIALNKRLGREYGDLENKLKEEMRRMLNQTRVFFARTPVEVKSDDVDVQTVGNSNL